MFGTPGSESRLTGRDTESSTQREILSLTKMGVIVLSIQLMPMELPPFAVTIFPAEAGTTDQV